jgi:lysophospholipase L1-like esterase
MAALGNSVTQAYAAVDNCFLIFCDRPQYSWATGDQLAGSTAQNGDSESPGSHRERIEAGLGAPMASVQNRAVSGATMSGLPGQASNVIADTEYVLVLMGHNDICGDNPGQFTDAASFESNYRTALDTLKNTKNVPNIVVSGLANVTKLYEASWNDVTGAFDPGCQEAWGSTNSSDPCDVVLTKGHYLDDSGYTWRDLANAKVGEFTGILAAGAADYGAHFIPETTHTSFNLTHLSTFDCFHPSVGGQQFLAQVTWENGIYS